MESHIAVLLPPILDAIVAQARIHILEHPEIESWAKEQVDQMEDTARIIRHGRVKEIWRELV